MDTLETVQLFCLLPYMIVINVISLIKICVTVLNVLTFVGITLFMVFGKTEFWWVLK